MQKLLETYNSPKRVTKLGEQPLPPYGACLLGSFNLVKYFRNKSFDWDSFISDIPHVVRAMDNVVDRTTYPLPEQEQEAKNKRRMGLGVTGIANMGELLGLRYGSEEYLEFQDRVLETLRNESYRASALLSSEKGSFPLFDLEKYLDGNYIRTLPEEIKDLIRKFGIRNSHLTSIAPTGTISLTADNVSSGIEPPFLLEYERTIQTFEGPRIERVRDYAYEYHNVKGLTANEIGADTHVRVLSRAQKYIDSAVSKTCNVGDGVLFNDFKRLYMDAYEGGCKGITTFRAAGKRYGVLNAVKEEPVEEETVEEVEAAVACFYDPSTGKRECE